MEGTTNTVKFNPLVCGNEKCLIGYGDSTPSEDGHSCFICHVDQVPASTLPFEDLNVTVQKTMWKAYTHCSKCGGEKDSEGWCPSYCMEGE